MERETYENKKMTMAERIYMIRMRRGISKAQLSVMIDTSVTTITKWENGGNIRPGKVKALAKALSVTEYFLYEGQEHSVDQIRGCISFAAQQGFILPENEPWLLSILDMYTYKGAKR